jgi:hypothetical protein
MTGSQKIVRNALSTDRPLSAALQRIQVMASDPQVKWTEAPSLQTADELGSVWSIRLWNSVLKGRRILGLRDFIRSVNQLPPKAEIQQVVLRKKEKTGLVFIDPKRNEVLGAILTSVSAANQQTAQRNASSANGSSPPTFLKSFGHEKSGLSRSC